MKIGLSSPRALDFACHSKACAPPPAGRGGSSKKSGYYSDINKHRTTTVTVDGDIAVSNRGGRLPLFKVRGSKSQAWVTDRETTAASRKRIKSGG